MEKYVLKNVDAILARNSMAKDVLIKKNYAKIIEIVTHGVDISAFKPRDKSELCHKFNAQNKPVIGYVGTLSEHKGLKYLFRAAKDIDCKILLIGDGSEKQSLLNLSKELKLDVVFLPSLKHAEVANYMNCMDIFVLPSLTMPNWVEKFGRVLIEAMASGLPVIGSDSGEIPNVLGDAGLTFKEKDISDLREKIQLLLNNIDLRNTLINKGVKRVNELYSWKTIAEQTIDVYNRVLNLKNSN
jgi:glycosyltransferase involved in cell wall biosynthesis